MSGTENNVDNGRRAFLRGAFLTREGREGYEQQQRPLGPAPPWHQGHLDAERCQACDAHCVDACRPGIIKLHPEEHRHSGQPYLNFEASGCTFCADCVTACPMELDNATTPAKLGQVQLNKQTCLAWNDVFCMSCRGHCDHGALSFDQQRRMQLDTDACTGCGRCLSVCPNQTLSFHLRSL